MSDIFIKTGASGQTGWRKVSNIFVKTNPSGQTGWRQAITVFLRTAEQWLRVWPTSGVYSTRTAWIGPDSTTAFSDAMPSTGSPYVRIGSNYYGNNAQWDPNGFTIGSYSYAWKYYSTNDGTSVGTTFSGESGTGSGWTSGGSGQDLLPTTTWSNATNNLTYDRKYIRFEVTANATNSTYSGFSTSPYIQIVRRVPSNISASLSAGPYSIGTQISFSSSWDTSEARKIESARTTIKWYKVASLTNITSTGTREEITRVSGSYNFTPQESDNVNNFFIVAEETVFNSGTDADYGTNGVVNGVNQITVATATKVAVYPGNLSSVQQYNFDAGQATGFFTTGVNTTSVEYNFTCTSIPNFTIPSTGTFTQSTSSSLPYKIQRNLLSYFTLETWNNDTYSAVTTYTKGSLVWFAGNRYEGKDVGFSGFLPTNTTYWTLSSTTASPWSSSTSYSAGNTVWYLGAVYTCGVANSNKTPGQTYLDQFGEPINYWSFSFNFANTYNASTTYYQNNSVNYNGSTYAAKALSWSGQSPTNTTYWSIFQTVTYDPGDYVLYNSTYYFCKATTNGTYPTNTTFWNSGSVGFTMSATPYNGTLAGTVTATAPQTIIINANGTASDPLRISAGPTFSNVTKTAFRSTFTPSIYANRAIIDIRTGGASITNYPRQLTVTGATQTSHDTVTTLVKNTTYAVTVQARYMYDSTYSVLHDGETTASTNVTTLPDAPGAFTISSASKAYGVTQRQVSLSWNSATDATSYSYFIEGSDNGTTWATVNLAGTSTAVTYANTSTTSTSATVSVTKYRYYRVSVRAVNSGGTTDSTSNPFNASGTAPGDPTIGTITVGASQVSVAYTNSSTVGSSDIIGVQYKLGAAGSWSSTQTSSPFTFNNPAAGNYTLYLRSINDDQLTSTGDANKDFTVLQTPDTFTYTISNDSSVTAPSAPTHQQVSGTNTVIIGWETTKPTNTNDYTVFVYGTGSATGGTQASPAQQTVTTLNGYNDSGIGGTGTWDAVTSISSSASNSPISVYIRANGTTRTVRANVSTTGNASSWAVNYTVSSASAGNGTYTLNTNSMPATIFTDTGASNPTITINSVTAYSGSNQTGATRAGTAGTTTSLSGVAKPTATSSVTTNNYTYIAPPAAPSGGSVGTPTLSSGTDGVIGAQYSANVTAEATGNPTPTKTYQWQYLQSGTSDTWVSITGATSSTFTVPWDVNTSISMPGRTFRCQVTWTNTISGVNQSVSQPSNSDFTTGIKTMQLPTITNVVSWYITGGTTTTRYKPTVTGGTYNGWPKRPPGTDGDSYVVWYIEGYNMRGVNSRTSVGTTSAVGTLQVSTTISDANNIYASSTTVPGFGTYAGGIYRQTAIAGAAANQWVALRMEPYGAPQGGGFRGQRKVTDAVRNTGQGGPVTAATLTDITTL